MACTVLIMCAVGQLTAATQFSGVWPVSFQVRILPWASVVYPAAYFHKVCSGIIISECAILPNTAEIEHLHKPPFLKKVGCKENCGWGSHFT